MVYRIGHFYIVKLDKFSLYAVFVQIENYSGFNLTLPYDDVVCGYNKESGDKVMDELSPVWISISAANRLIGEVVQSRRRPLLGPSPG